MKPEALAKRLLDLAARVGKVVDALPKTRLGNHIAGHLVRSGTSPAPNDEKACAAESRKDFIHKLRIGPKKLRETQCWIRLIIKSELLPESRIGELLRETDVPCKISGQSVVTARRNEKQNFVIRHSSSGSIATIARNILKFALNILQFAIFSSRICPIEQSVRELDLLEISSNWVRPITRLQKKVSLTV